MSAAWKPLRILLAASGALLVAGCGGLIQTYEGPRKPVHDVAIIKTNVGELTFDTVWIDLVDGKNLVRAYSEIEVLPDRHSVRVQLSSGFIKASGIVAFEANAGRTYHAMGTILRSGPRAWIEDNSTGEIVAGEKP
jgi:hypothetical protein